MDEDGTGSSDETTGSDHGGTGSGDGGTRLAVLASGSGTILEAILASGIPVELVVVDRSCGAEEVARRFGVSLARVPRSRFRGDGDLDRRAFSLAVAETLELAGVGLVAMAGFATVLAPEFFDRFGGLVLNTHPALLPAFRGWGAVGRALAAGVPVTGCTVHVATPAVDEGPVLAREEVAVLAGDDEESLHERIKTVERRLYPAVIAQVLAGDSSWPVASERSGVGS